MYDLVKNMEISIRAKTKSLKLNSKASQKLPAMVTIKTKDV